MNSSCGGFNAIPVQAISCVCVILLASGSALATLRTSQIPFRFLSPGNVADRSQTKFKVLSEISRKRLFSKGYKK